MALADEIASKRVAFALGEIDPADRALLDLSLRQGRSDAELAELTGIGIAEVRARRGELLRELAVASRLELGGNGHGIEGALRRLPSSWWLAPPQTPPAESAATERTGSRRRGAWIVALVLTVAAVAAIVLTAGGEDAERATSPAPRAADRGGPSDTAPAQAARERQLELSPLGPGSNGAVSATISRGESPAIELRLEGLAEPDGRYELWLYNSLLDSFRLGALASGDGTISAPLPADAKRYRYLDLSLEPAPYDGRPSGQSVFRAELAAPAQP